MSTRSARVRLCSSSASPTSRRSDAALPPTAIAMSTGPGVDPRQRARGVHAHRGSSSARRRVPAQVGVGQESRCRTRTRPTTRRRRRASRRRSRSTRRPRRRPRRAPAAGARACASRPGRPAAPPPRPSSTHTSTPPCARMASQNSSRLAARRITAVATARMLDAPACSASACCSATTPAVSAIRAAGIVPPGARPRPRRVNARRCRTSVRPPGRASATSTRVVFVPISMQPQSIRPPAMLP